MSLKKTLSTPTFRDTAKQVELNEEWTNFMKRVGEVGNLVRDLSSGDKERAEAATILADQYLDGKVILDEDVKLTVKADRTVINEKAFKSLEKKNPDSMDKDVWMAEMSKDAEKRALDRKIRREKADTFKTQATKAFHRGEYEKALSCYNKAIDQIKDSPVLYCDRALTNLKLGNFDKVLEDCDLALRLNENSFKARLYIAKARKEMNELEKLEEMKKKLEDKFPQHLDLVTYFLDKQLRVELEEEGGGDSAEYDDNTILI